MLRPAWILGICLALHCGVARPTSAAEPPVLPGLELWLDAAAAGRDNASGKSLSKWDDRSPLKRAAVQAKSDHQPKLVKVEDAWVVRFDGEDDHLRVMDVKQSLKSFTLFVVAAPHSNHGFFRGLFAFNQVNRRDYESGFTLDMNAPMSTRLDNINLEGRGFGGARNLLKTPAPFGTLRSLECVADPAAKRIRLVIDGQPQMDREFAAADLSMDDITIGARFYTNEPDQPQQVRGFFHGDLAEVLLFNRVLTDSESRQVREYLDKKHGPLREALPRALNLYGGANSEPLVTVDNPPAIQMLVPGFSVFDLPVDLPNINNVGYRADGKLYALGYGGDVWLLSDKDGDGLEETVTKFFDSKGRLRGPIGMAVIPEGHALLKSSMGKSRGIVVPSKGKVSALLDHDGDDVADEERVIASGWKEITQNVDAIGAALGPDGSIYFGLGTAQYDNAYLIDKNGKAHYDVNSDRGTIQRILPDLSKWETVCTGVRFTIGMAIKDRTDGPVDANVGLNGDLYVTDQEGATWLPNGNPYDELLRIERGKHYGFPPRHPRHNPEVVDAPSLFDYGPQHQSTCGMAFNQPRGFSLSEPAKGRHEALFGPASWAGNAFVTGESRGKLYRTEIHHGKLARNHLIACLSMLTIDCCLPPQGDMVVACHSGGPDWGSGPSGKGKLFKIRYTNKRLGQPVAVWPSGPQEVRVAFDRALDPAQLKNLNQARITYGPYVAAGDRFETLWPGYAVVQMQKAAPRYNLPVRGISVTPDRQTLVLATDPHPVAWQYALTFPGLGRDDSMKSDSKGTKPLPQHPEVDLAYSLQGVSATWEPTDRTKPGWRGWLPHLDLDLANDLTGGIIGEDRFREVIQQPGTLTLETKLDVRDLVHPAVQPGSKLDHEWPEEQIRIEAKSNVPIVLQEVAVQAASSTIDRVERPDALTVSSKATQPVHVRLRIATGGVPSLHVNFRTATSVQPIALHRMILPWAETKFTASESTKRPPIPELAEGSWGRGRRVFWSEEAGCAKCHVARGETGRIGPDLANLIHRDYASVLRDITQPSFALNPDFLSSVVSLKDGRVLTGTIRSDGDKLLVGDKDGKVHLIAAGDVDELRHSSVSIMPEGMPQKLGPQRMKDLLTFLLTEPPQMPWESPLPAPKPRTRAEVERVVAHSEPPTLPLRPVNLLLVAGAKDHGPGEHDYPAWQRGWKELLLGAEAVTVDTAMEWPSAEQIARADTIVFFQKGSWNAERAAAMDAHLARKRGLVYIHWAVEAGAEAPAFAQRIGLASNAAKLKFRHGPLDLGFETGRDHPIGRNFDRVHFHDESYWQMQGDLQQIRVLATGIEDGMAQPLFWTLEPNQGRVFVSILGHYSWTFDDPLFRILLLRGIAWSARESVDRWNELATIGVKLAD